MIIDGNPPAIEQLAALAAPQKKDRPSVTPPP
jgi:hypothetical protein